MVAFGQQLNLSTFLLGNLLIWSVNASLVWGQIPKELFSKIAGVQSNQYYSNPALHLSLLSYRLMLLDYSGSKKPYTKKAMAFFSSRKAGPLVVI